MLYSMFRSDSRESDEEDDKCKNKYKWIFIDSLTEISQNLMEQLYLEFPERKDSLVMYGENGKRMRSLIKSFRDIPYYNVVMTALSAVDKDENNVRITGVSMVGNISEKAYQQEKRKRDA